MAGRSRVLGDLRVRHADVFGHQECRRAHHRRHDLAVDAGCGLDRAGFFRRVADALHQRNRERSAGDDVGDRRARDHAHHPRRHDGRLGRPAAHVSEKSKRDLDEVVACACFFQQRAKQNEQENVARRHAYGYTEDPFGRQPVMRDRFGQRHALVLDDVRHPRAGERVDQHQGRDDGQRRADDAARRFQQQQHADERGDEVYRRRLAGPGRQLAIEQEEIRAAKTGDQREYPVRHRDSDLWATSCGTGRQGRRRKARCRGAARASRYR